MSPASSRRLAEPERDLLATTPEVRIETSAGPGAAVHRTIVWVVVDPQGRAFVRSYRGPGARWYRETLANPACRIHVSGMVVNVSAVPATDPPSITACSEALARKYAGDPSMPPMVRNHLETTLELVPR